MRVFLLLTAIAFMASTVHGESSSMSCSMVNGKMICDSQRSSGNTAMSSSHASSGGGQGSFQSTMVGTGDTYTGTFSSSGTQVGKPPAGMFNPMDFVNGAMGGMFPFGRR